MMIFALLLACALPAAFTLPMTSQPTYISPGGNHCFPCPPGTHVSDHCTTDLTDSKCIACPEHHYSEEPNQKTHCTQCRPECPKNGYSAQKCTASTNRLCICHDGFHKYPVDPVDPHWKCKSHNQCNTGEGEVYSGNFTHDTKCRKCTDNEFVDKSDPDHPVCRACTTCSPDTVEMKPCAADADTECVSNVTTSLSVTVINFTTTSSPHSGEPSGDEGLGGGGIAGIVLAILAVIIVVVVIVCVVRRKQRRGSQPPPASHDESDEEQETRARFISHSPDAPNASTANGAVTMSSLLSSPADELIEWNENYISRDVFRELSRLLGDKWKVFIVHLPGWEQQQGRVQALIEQATMDEHSTLNRIVYCLREWQKDCPDRVTRQDILKTLEEIGAKNLVDEFRSMKPN